MVKKFFLALLVLTFFSSTAAAQVSWEGSEDTDWTNGNNWAGGFPPDNTDWADIRGDDWVPNFPVIPVGQTVEAQVVRLSPNFGGTPQTATITMDGGTLNLQLEMRLGETAVAADVVMNSGEINVGLANVLNRTFTAVGMVGGKARILMNGGTFNAGLLGMPVWFDGGGDTGNVLIDGGNLNTTGIIIDFVGNSPTSGIEFTKDLAAGGGLLTDTQDLDETDWTNWQDQVLNWIGDGRITTSTGGFVQPTFSSLGTIRTTVLSSVAGIPGDFNGDLHVDGADFLLWQRGGTSPPLDPLALAAWQTNFGASPPAISAVPEPASILFVAVGLVALATCRRSRD